LRNTVGKKFPNLGGFETIPIIRIQKCFHCLPTDYQKNIATLTKELFHPYYQVWYANNCIIVKSIHNFHTNNEEKINEHWSWYQRLKCCLLNKERHCSLSGQNLPRNCPNICLQLLFFTSIIEEWSSLWVLFLNLTFAYFRECSQTTLTLPTMTQFFLHGNDDP